MKKSIIVQLAYTFILASQNSFISFSMVWPSYALKILESADSPLGFSLTKSESNLVGSIPMLGSLISTLFAGYVCDSIGRKKSHILNSLLFVVSWSLIVTARSTAQILIGRFVTGISNGMSIVVLVVYVSEISQLEVRGSATAMQALLYNVGILISYFEGWFFSYNAICYANVTASALYTLLICCFKDTPVHLLKLGQEKEALAALKFFRGESNTTEEILEELSYLKSLKTSRVTPADIGKSNDVEEMKKLQPEKEDFVENSENKNPWKLIVTVDNNRRALITIVSLMSLTVSMGMIAVQTYAGEFFTMAAPTMSPDLCSVLFAIVLVVSSFISIVVTDMFPRRLLMISSCAIASICLALIGSVLRWSWGPSWLVPLVILVFCVVFHVGCINITFVQLAESFGPQVNSTASAIALCAMFIMNFVVLSLFVPSVDYLGIDGTFFTFAGIAVVTTIVSFFFVKETRSVPLKKVQKMFAQGYLYKKSDDLL